MLQLPSASPGGAAPSVSEGGAEAAGPRLRHRRWSEQFWRPARDLSVKGDVPVSPVAPRKCQDILYEQVGARSVLYAQRGPVLDSFSESFWAQFRDPRISELFGTFQLLIVALYAK